MNQSGEIFRMTLSNGHTADIKMVEHLVEGLQAKLYADRGYISHELKSKLKSQNIDLITYHRKNMQLIHLSKEDEYHLKQRNKIETLFSLLKRDIQFSHEQSSKCCRLFGRHLCLFMCISTMSSEQANDSAYGSICLNRIRVKLRY